MFFFFFLKVLSHVERRLEKIMCFSAKVQLLKAQRPSQNKAAGQHQHIAARSGQHIIHGQKDTKRGCLLVGQHFELEGKNIL